MDKNFENWFIGFFDGEGWFSVYERKSRYKNHYNFNKSFEIGIGIVERDEIVLKDIQTYFKVGSFRKRIFQNPNHQTQTYWEVKRRDEIEKMIDFFENNPLRTPNKLTRFNKFKDTFQEYRGSKPSKTTFKDKTLS